MLLNNCDVSKNFILFLFIGRFQVPFLWDKQEDKTDILEQVRPFAKRAKQVAVNTVLMASLQSAGSSLMYSQDYLHFFNFFAALIPVVETKDFASDAQQSTFGVSRAANSSHPDDSVEQLMQMFNDRVKQHLHIVVTMAPSSILRKRLINFPSLVSCTRVIWFSVSASRLYQNNYYL